MSLPRGALGIWAAVVIAAVAATLIACSDEHDDGVIAIFSQKGMI